MPDLGPSRRIHAASMAQRLNPGPFQTVWENFNVTKAENMLQSRLKCIRRVLKQAPNRWICSPRNLPESQQ
jgi:hypothetical protein